MISPASVECLDKVLHAISVGQYPSDQELRVVSPVGTAFPIHCTAHGKALLSTFSEALLTQMLTAPLERRTGSTIVSLNTLIEEVNVVREQGWAIDQEEHAQGVCGIGVNIRRGYRSTTRSRWQSRHYASTTIWKR
ncbi:IclR family transcriptional regulator domain-containing protein [Pseudomonas putida]|uniref:IclR family transcriptional regulator domain-containing protein n=1 Tax=Pseudomonas putida TaxID=303 RepID=UPI003F2B0B8C